MIERSTTILSCLCALLLGACDVPSAPEARDERAPADERERLDTPDELAPEDELDGVVLTTAELLDLCAAPRDQARTHPAAIALALCPQLNADGASAGPPIHEQFSNAPHPSKGVCSTGVWKNKFVSQGCNSCVFDTPNPPDQRMDVYAQFCYTAPSPPSCGCESWEYVSSTCANYC